MKDPKKAAIYSSIIPGLGQVYTKQYWKVPIIYAGLNTSAYYINENHNQYTLYKQTYINRTNGDYFDSLEYTNQDLLTLTTHYRRNTEISILLFTLTYILNIVDASVNAHLFEYNINEDLSMVLEPIYLSLANTNITGVAISIKL